MDHTSLIPNTTQIPHLIIREWMPRLKDVELRVLLVVADQTLGWVEDRETGKRKEKDWISQYFLMKKINRSDRAVQKAIHKLVDELQIVQAYDEQGQLLDSSQKRMKCGGKIFYRLSLRAPQPMLFSLTPERSSGVARHGKKFTQPPKNLRAKKVRATKETRSTQLSPKGRAEHGSDLNKSVENPVDNGGESTENPLTQLTQQPKETAPTRYFFWKFGQLCQAIRNQKPIFVKHKDGKLITHALRHLNEFQLELELIWFLQNKREMGASFGAALCKEVIGDFIKASFREYGFYGSLERTALHYSTGPGQVPKKKTEDEAGAMTAMVDALRKLKESFGMPFSNEVRTQIAEETAMTERAARI